MVTGTFRTRQYGWTVPILGLALSVGAAMVAVNLPVCAERGMPVAEGFLVTEETAPMYRRIPVIENQLYGHGYPNQALSQRMSRIERTLFGAGQRGPMEIRMQRIETHMKARNSQAVVAENEPILTYLEEKMFQRTFSDTPLPERLHQLESQVFGRTFESYPTSIRVKKLTYAMPIMAKEIRLTKKGEKGDRVIASTNRISSRYSRESAPLSVDMVQLDASGSTIRRLPYGESLSIGDYSQSIYRNAEGFLRWENLPIKVYVKPQDADQALVSRAIKAWQTIFSVEMVPESHQADVIVAWDAASWAQNTTGLLTRPVMQVDGQRNLRTVILITMAPVKHQTEFQRLHVLSHQLGHAFGLWGHSEDPADIMFPAFIHEKNDFPSKWAWRSATVGSGAPLPMPSGVVQPSPRDANTLLKIYSMPAVNLSSYDPY